MYGVEVEEVTPDDLVSPNMWVEGFRITPEGEACSVAEVRVSPTGKHDPQFTNVHPPWVFP